ncbi:MAG: hypothetical protein AAF721_02155 [Myxococcota bacterium]
MPRFAFVALLAALSCKGTNAPTASGPPLDVTIVHASYDAHSDTPNVIKEKCKFHEQVAKAVHAGTPGSSISTGPSTLVLSMVIVTMRGVDPTWEGDSSVIVRGELRDGGTLRGSFRVRYSAEPGVLGGMAGRCQALDDIASFMADDIVPWLRDPAPGSKLGES